MEERIQKLLSGVCSRRTAEAYIAAGRVSVNGKPAVPGQRADPVRDTVLLDGKPLPPRTEKPVWILLNKPRGCVTTLSDERGRPTVADLVRDCGVRVYPVGRLDRNSEGLLLLTNDGELARRLTHPGCGAEKVYHVTVALLPETLSPKRGAGTPSDTARNRKADTTRNQKEDTARNRKTDTEWNRKNGAARVYGGGKLEQAAVRLSTVTDLNGETVRPAEVELLSRGPGRLRLSVTIREGKNRQIRRLCEQCGLRVLRLRRIREHTVELGDLRPGQWRYLTDAELAALRTL